MADGIYTALSGALAQERNLEIISNNLANLSTAGFKSQRTSFREALAVATGYPAAVDYQVALGVVTTDFRQGALHASGNPLDVAILDDSFFAVETAGGERYTRAGAFTLSPSGLLATSEGLAVLGEGGPIAIGDAGRARIAEDGRVLAGGREVGRLRLVRFARPEALLRQGSGLWVAPAAAGLAPANEPRLAPGSLEQANVNPLQAMTEIIMVARTHEVFHRAIEMFRAIDEKTANEVGR